MLRCSERNCRNFGVPALGDENVGGLDVSMNDALGVGGIERICDLDSERQHGFVVQWLSGDSGCNTGVEPCAMFDSWRPHQIDFSVISGRRVVRFSRMGAASCRQSGSEAGS